MLWRMKKHTGIVSDGQLTSVDQLEDHVAELPVDDLKELKIDVHNFLDYWPHNSKQYTAEYIAHIFGIVCNTLHHTYVQCLQKVSLSQYFVGLYTYFKSDEMFAISFHPKTTWLRI